MTFSHLQIIVGFGLCFATAAKGADQYCAFAVKVSNALGKPLAGISVAMIQREGKEVGHEVLTDVAGRARLCDAPMESVDIIVGVDICGAVAIKQVTPSWPVTKQLYFTYEAQGCNHFGDIPSCTILLRVLDEVGRPVPDAVWTADGISGRSTSSDRFGRIFQSMDVGRILMGVVTKRGIAPVNVSVPCAADGERLIEKKISIPRAQ
jgi:hypothetical protein